MMNNERKNTADFQPWDSVEGLGWSVSQQHKLAAGQMGGYFERNHLGRDRVSLAAGIHRRYNQNSSPVFRGTGFPLVNFFSRKLLQPHDGGGESLSEYSPLGMDSLHRMVDIATHKPPIGIRRGLTDVRHRSAIGLADNENSSALIYPNSPSGQSSIITSDATQLRRIPHSPYVQRHISEQAGVHKRTGGIDGKPSLDNSLIAIDAGTNGGHFPGPVQRAVDRRRGKGFVLNPAFESAFANFAPQEHEDPDSKTAPMPMVNAVSGVPVISPKAEPTSEVIARKEQIPSEAAQSGGNRSRSSVQRAVNRQNGVRYQNRYGSQDNNIFSGEPLRFAGNEIWTADTPPHFAPPFATVNRKFSLSSGNRFEGLGIGRKITDHAVGTLSQQGFAADFFPASAASKSAPLGHDYLDTKSAPMADVVSEVPVISPKAEPTSEVIARREQIPSKVTPPGINRSQSSVQRAVNRQNGVLTQNSYGSQDTNVIKGETPRISGYELWTADNPPHFAIPLVTVNRKISLSSDDKTAPMADSVSGVPVISPKAEPNSEVIARREQIPSEVTPSGNNSSQSSLQRALNRQNSLFSQNKYGSRDNNVAKGEPARFAGYEFWGGHTSHFATPTPLATVNRKISLSSGNRFEGLGIGRKITDYAVGTPSQQGFAEDFNSPSAVVKSAPLEHYSPDSKANPMTDAVSGVPVISSKAEPSSGVIDRREQIPSEAAHAGNNRSKSSVQRAVDRQNSSLPQVTPEPRIRHKIPELPITVMRNSKSVASPGNTANSVELKPEINSAKREDAYQLNSSQLAVSQGPQRGYPAISSNNNSKGESGNSIHSNSISSLLMRSAIISPAREIHRIQASLGQQLPSIQSPIFRAIARKNDYTLHGNSTRPVQTAGLNVLRLLSEANLFSGGEVSFIPGISRASPIEQGDSFNSDRAMDRSTHLPLSPPYVVQRKTVLSGDYAGAGDGSGYLQRKDVSNGSSETAPSASAQKVESSGSQASKAGSISLSPDEMVDKVWRKLMRKLLSEQERMGGSNRWA